MQKQDHARAHRIQGADRIEVALIWSIAKFRKCSQQSFSILGLAPVVALHVDQVCQNVDR